MSDKQQMLAFEDNLAEWWEAHTLATGDTADRRREMIWSLDKADGNSGLGFDPSRGGCR